MLGLTFRAGMVLSLLSFAILPTQADGLADLTQRVAALEGDFNSLESKINDNASQIRKLSELVGDAFTKLQDQDAKQQTILDKISATDENGEIYLPLNSIMNKSATARQEVRNAVEQSIHKQGTLTIVNEMGISQDIIVNRIQHHVLAGATLNLTVPVGTVSTQLPGQKVVNWTIGVPNYRQSVSIKPQRYTAGRVPYDLPGSSTWVSPPRYGVYYNTPVYEPPIYYGDHFWHNDHFWHGGHSWHDNHGWGNHHAYY